MPVERELTQPVDLCRDRGRLNPDAVGWSRRPLHRCNLRGRFPRKKRWEFWGVLTDAHLLRVTYGAADYLGTIDVSLLDIATGTRIRRTRLLPFARGMRFPDTVAGGTMTFTTPTLSVGIDETSGGTHLACRLRHPRDGRELDADLTIALPAGHETLSVVVPWSTRRFQYTSKHTARPARGLVTLRDATFHFGPENNAYGILDFGRGVWPYRTSWNWAAASGRQDGRTIGLNLGGRWTDATGSTENGLCLDGRLHKIGEDLVWTYDRRDFRRPWRIHAPRSGRIDLQFTPLLLEHEHTELLVLGTDLHWALGRFSGTVVTDDGEPVVLDGLPGWAEEHRARW